jgi:hypothetical protein
VNIQRVWRGVRIRCAPIPIGGERRERYITRRTCTHRDEKVANLYARFGTGRRKMALERWTNPNSRAVRVHVRTVTIRRCTLSSPHRVLSLNAGGTWRRSWASRTRPSARASARCEGPCAACWSAASPPFPTAQVVPAPRLASDYSGGAPHPSEVACVMNTSERFCFTAHG